MTHDEMIAVIAAHRDGKEIEARARGVEDDWYPCQTTGTFFNFRTYEYRIKPVPPKPREWWIGPGYILHDNPTPNAIRVIEVLPSTGEEDAIYLKPRDNIVFSGNPI